MDAYEQAVDFYAKNCIDSEFPNKGSEHATIVISRIFEYAEQYVKIFSGKLNSDVADNPKFIQSLKRYINSGKKLEVIVEEIPEIDKSNALKLIIESSKNPMLDVSIKKASNEFLESVRNSFKSKNIYHFIVSDDRAYRVEVDKNNFKARCNFNDTHISSILNNTFSNFFK